MVSLRPLVGGEQMEQKVGGQGEGSDRNLIADLQRGEQLREPGIGLDIGAVKAGQLADAGDDRVGNRFRERGGHSLILRVNHRARDGSESAAGMVNFVLRPGSFCRVTGQNLPRFTLY